MQKFDHRSLINGIIWTQELVLVRQGKRLRRVWVIEVLLYQDFWQTIYLSDYMEHIKSLRPDFMLQLQLKLTSPWFILCKAQCKILMFRILIPVLTLTWNWALLFCLKVSVYSGLSTYSRLSLSRSWRDPLKHFEISVLRHTKFSELRKIQIAPPHFRNEYEFRIL